MLINQHPQATIAASNNDPQLDPLKTATGVYITVHGHFYQPPRENPYLDAIERQPSAAPFHDWNERIHHECYRPNAFARILNDRGELIEIINNFEYMSFNIGPTLMSWLERYDIEAYQRILEADRKSCDRLNGHGNAIAQVYNHIIMPLANERDKRTQIRWGIEDFRSRFGRDPQGMWLAEAAVDYPTVAALIENGIRFIVLAPSQAQRCRPISDQDTDKPDWVEVGGSQIDPTRPYRCFLPDGDPQTDYLDVFFYDGPISRDMGFNDVLESSQLFAGRVGQAVRGEHQTQLISMATDGETFGHHKPGREKAVAYAFAYEFPKRGWTVTNYAHYLSLCPPTWEVELKPVTAWSCCHGVDRWQDDCGCGGGGTWNQQWRRPLRQSLDWLRDRLISIYDEASQPLFNDPWQARDEYIEVIRDRSSSTLAQFLDRHQTHPLSDLERVDALRLLEMQRHALLMYTSCGWFFDELSRPEGVQILRYAARAIELAAEVTGTRLEDAFVYQLTDAPSNVEFFRNGAAVYRHLVIPSQINLRQVAAHYAISSLFTTYDREQHVYCYRAQQLDYQLQRMGSLTLAVGRVELTSDITTESEDLVFAVLHLGGWDFHCCIQPFSGRRDYSQMKDEVFDALHQASAAHAILAMSRVFGDQSYSLENLFAEERHRIMRLLSQETLTRLDQLYTQVYRDNYGVLMAFHRDELDVPIELQVAAEVAISHRAATTLRSLERDAGDFPNGTMVACMSYLSELEAIATEADSLHCKLNLPDGRPILEQLILRSLWYVFQQEDVEQVSDVVKWIERLVQVGDVLHLNLSLDRAQELYTKHLRGQVLPLMDSWGIDISAIDPSFDRNTSVIVPLRDRDQVRQLLHLGTSLTIDVACWLDAMQ